MLPEYFSSSFEQAIFFIICVLEIVYIAALLALNNAYWLIDSIDND